MIHFHTVPNWIKRFFKSFVWHISTKEKIIYLTFDDGPIPGVTEFVIDELAKYNAKASFFCVGDNISKNPEVFIKLVRAGHAIGNHTFNHVKGWQMKNEAYFENISRFEKEIENFNLKFNLASFQHDNLKLFRPPYGRIKPSQAKVLRQDYKIIMWDVLTCDYDKLLLPECCLANAIKYTKPGSVVLFHDSLKAERNMKFTLPKYLEHYANLGYQFESLA